MKFGNGTGTDTTAPVGEVRDGTRLTGFKVELGFTDITNPSVPLPRPISMKLTE